MCRWCRGSLEPFISANQYDPDADLLPTWQGKYRVHYQVSGAARQAGRGDRRGGA